MERLIFKEEQKFRQGWVWATLVALPLPSLLIVWRLIEALKTGSNEYLLLMFILLFYLVFTVPLIWLFIKMKLIVEIRKDGIWFKFSPLLYKWKSISKSEIESFEVRKYKPVWEYGGWGIKGRFKSKAYNVSGDIGLQLYLKNERKVLFGTQRKDAIEAAMKKMINDQ